MIWHWETSDANDTTRGIVGLLALKNHSSQGCYPSKRNFIAFTGNTESEEWVKDTATFEDPPEEIHYRHRA